MVCCSINTEKKNYKELAAEELQANKDDRYENKASVLCSDMGQGPCLSPLEKVASVWKSWKMFLRLSSCMLAICKPTPCMAPPTVLDWFAMQANGKRTASETLTRIYKSIYIFFLFINFEQ